MKQEAGGVRRRWFEDEALELIVWYRGDGAVDGFQLCYPGADRRERALTWQARRGFSHSLVDGGDTRPDKNLTPVLTPDGAVPWQKLEAEFGARAAGLEPALREFVLGWLRRRNG